MWILVLSRRQWLYHAADRRFGVFFFFLLWTAAECLHVDLVLSRRQWLYHVADRRFGFFFFFSCCGLVAGGGGGCGFVGSIWVGVFFFFLLLSCCGLVAGGGGGGCGCG